MARGRRRGTGRLVVAALVLVLTLTVEAGPASAAPSNACRILSTDTGQTFTALQPAVDAAKPGAHLVVRGTCHGKTIIGKRLVIEGQRTERLGKPILDGDGRDRVLKVRRGVRVTMSDLTLQDGRTGRGGGGIVNRGTLRLICVVVRHNRSRYDGGGIWNIGTLWLTDSRVRENETGDIVGGIYNDHGTLILNGTSGINANLGQGVSTWGTLTMNDASTIRNNRHRKAHVLSYGGGVYNAMAVMTMNDSSSISGNRATIGGGVFISSKATLTMNDSSSISGNRATNARWDTYSTHPYRVNRKSACGGGVGVLWGGSLVMTGSSAIRDNSSAWCGGGLYAGATHSLTGVTCGPGGNVYGNTPDDCHIWYP